MRRWLIPLACCLPITSALAQTTPNRETVVGIYAGRIASTKDTGDRTQTIGLNVEQWVDDKGSIRLDITRPRDGDAWIVTFDGSYHPLKWLAVPFGIGWYDEKDTEITSVIGVNGGVGFEYWIGKFGVQLQGNYHFLLTGNLPERKFVTAQLGARFKF